MVRAFWKKRKIKLEFEKSISEWELKYNTPQQIISSFKYSIEREIEEKILSTLEVSINEEAKNLLYEILQDKEFKIDLKGSVTESIKSRFKNYLDNI